METLTFKIEINAPKEKVWEVMLGDKTYREWTAAFHEGSFYEGSWDKGSEIKFLGPDEHGELGGMAGKIVENIPYEYLSIEYMGLVANGEVDLTSEMVKEWAGAHENYTFTEQDNVTTLVVELEGHGISDEMGKMFTESWPKSLQKLKEIVERS